MRDHKKLGDSLLIKIDFEILRKKGINEREVNKYIPSYLYKPSCYRSNSCSKIILKSLPFVLGYLFRLILNPRRGSVGKLGPNEVDLVYKREARSYNRKHHLTTRGMDLSWRREASYVALNAVLGSPGKISVLDLCTGTGLTARELMLLCQAYGTGVDIMGLDYSRDMLKVARSTVGSIGQSNVVFVRGDATRLTTVENNEFIRLQPNSFNVVLQMFGIGGISEPLASILEILKVLKNGGQYCLIDMHKPITWQAGEWPFFTKWIRSPYFEMACYEKVTLPLALARQWAWRDTTSLFYLSRLTTFYDEKLEEWSGFKTLSFEFIPQRWWLSLPIMPRAKLILQKTKISYEEAKFRNNILSACQTAGN